MDTIINLLQNNWEMWRDGLVLLFALTGLFLLGGTFRQMKKLNKSLNSITANMQEYFNVILNEEEEPEEKQLEDRMQEEADEEKEIQAKIENLKKQEEQEKLFNAVLQEYFS